MTEPVITARGLKKQFGDFAAVAGIDFEVRPGEVTAVSITVDFDNLPLFPPPPPGQRDVP